MTNAAPEIVVGAVFVVPHPFLKGEFDRYLGSDGEGNADFDRVESWTPGVRFEPGPCAYGDDPDTVEAYDGTGAQILTVAAVFKPGKFPTRVFYTRKWRDPRGVEFGKGKLHIKTIANFRQIIAGYRHQNPTRPYSLAQFEADIAAHKQAADSTPSTAEHQT